MWRADLRPDTVGDVDGDAMCLDVKTAACGRTQPALSLALPAAVMSTEVELGAGISRHVL